MPIPIQSMVARDVDQSGASTARITTPVSKLLTPSAASAVTGLPGVGEA